MALGSGQVCINRGLCKTRGPAMRFRSFGWAEDKVVATDFRGDTRPSLVDADSGAAFDGTFAKISACYDNEWGYPNHLAH